MQKAVSNNSQRALSVAEIAASAEQMCRRFPITLGYMLVAYVAALLAIFEVYHEPFHVCWFGLLGGLASFAVSLWAENRSFVLKAVSQLVVFVIVGADLWYNYEYPKTLFDTVAVRRLVSVASLTVLIAFANCTANDESSWSRSFKAVKRLVITATFGLLVFLCVTAIFLTIDILFDVEVFRAMFVADITLAVFLPCLIYIAMTPRADETVDNAAISKFGDRVVRFIFLPLLGADMLILFAYMLDIIFSFSLPRGMVATGVSLFLAGMIIIEFLIYPMAAKSNTLRKIAAIMPLVALPLVIMMSVGIIYRICDYGFTGERLYVLTLNLWSYFALYALWRKNGRSITSVIISLALWLIAVTVIPGFNYMSVSSCNRAHDGYAADEVVTIETTNNTKI